jgi:DNA-binding MarR family transcriptional regulator
MDDPSRADSSCALGAAWHDPVLIERLDRALLRMRRAVVRPESTSVPIPALQRTVDLAKIMACLAIADLQDPEDPLRPVTVKDVAAALSLEHSTTSRLLADTEAEDLIRRTTDSQDRRRTVVHLTSTGQVVVEQSATIRTWSIDALLADWTPQELSTFTELIEKFSATIDERSAQVMAAGIQRFRDAP